MFKAGNQVVCINAKERALLYDGAIYIINKNQRGSMVTVDGIDERFFARRFELYKESASYPTLRSDYV